MKLFLEVTEPVYLEDLPEFNKELLIKDFAKVVQLKWAKYATLCPVRKRIYQMYVKEVTCIAKHNEFSLEEKKELLKDWVERQKGKKPELFSRIGWWDMKVALQGGMKMKMKWGTSLFLRSRRGW